MADNPWIPFYFADYLADTGTLSLAEHGAYLLLMAEAYRRGGVLNANASNLHRLCRCTDDADRAAVDSVLSQYFTRAKAGYSHKRIQKVLARRDEIKEKRSNAALRRWDANASPMQMQPQLHIQPHPESDPKTQEREVEGESPREGTKSRKRGKTAHVLPADWAPKPSHQTVATEQGVDLAAEVVKFTEHARSTGRRMVDWDLCLNTWLRRARDFGARPRTGGGQSVVHAKQDATRRAVEEVNEELRRHGLA